MVCGFLEWLYDEELDMLYLNSFFGMVFLIVDLVWVVMLMVLFDGCVLFVGELVYVVGVIV